MRKRNSDTLVSPSESDGWSLPLKIQRDGRIRESDGGRLLERAQLVLEVVPGERPLQPEFGCRVHQLVSLQTTEERQLAAALLEVALDRWLPQFAVERVDVLDVDGGRLTIALLVAGRRQQLTLEHRPSVGALYGASAGATVRGGDA